MTALFLLPLAFMVIGSLRAPGLPPDRSFDLVPGSVGLDSYERAYDLVRLGRFTLNSLVVAVLVVPLSVLVASLAGFGLVLVSRRSRTLFLAAAVLALMIPATALLVPRFAIFSALSLTDTWAPLVAPALIGMSPLYVLLYAWSFWRIPPELYDACRLQHLSPFRVWRQVAMPLVKPTTIAVGVLAFITSWGNFLDPLVYLYSPNLYTLPLGLRALAELDRTDFPVLMAGSVVATVPVIVAFLLVQRWLLDDREGRSSWLGN